MAFELRLSGASEPARSLVIGKLGGDPHDVAIVAAKASVMTTKRRRIPSSYPLRICDRPFFSTGSGIVPSQLGWTFVLGSYSTTEERVAESRRGGLQGGGERHYPWRTNRDMHTSARIVFG